jgi:hypothetical protein
MCVLSRSKSSGRGHEARPIEARVNAEVQRPALGALRRAAAWRLRSGSCSPKRATSCESDLRSRSPDPRGDGRRAASAGRPMGDPVRFIWSHRPGLADGGARPPSPAPREVTPQKRLIPNVTLKTQSRDRQAAAGSHERLMQVKVLATKARRRCGKWADQASLWWRPTVTGRHPRTPRRGAITRRRLFHFQGFGARCVRNRLAPTRLDTAAPTVKRVFSLNGLRDRAIYRAWKFGWRGRHVNYSFHQVSSSKVYRIGNGDFWPIDGGGLRQRTASDLKRCCVWLADLHGEMREKS